LTGADHVFQSTPAEVSKTLADMTEALLNGRRTVRELRHTAAQRFVDAGASEEELAAFMVHSDLNTGLVYFRSSVSQGERVNQALGVSAVYQRVVKIAHDRFISVKELTELKGDQQIAGVPHGVPIAGIGGARSGSPAVRIPDYVLLWVSKVYARRRRRRSQNGVGRSARCDEVLLRIVASGARIAGILIGGDYLYRTSSPK
jgi:hypothetical protein